MPNEPIMDRNTLKDNVLLALQTFFFLLLKGWKLWLVLALIGGAAWLLRDCRDSRHGLGGGGLRVERGQGIDPTPEEVRAVRRLGQLETLSIATEELAELHREGILRDDQLARIYVGTLRLGVDLERTHGEWFRVAGDTAKLTVPRVGLLDEDFIDEARTRPFYERGTWTAADRDSLYRQASERMRRRCLTEENLLLARRGATERLTQICAALGFRYVIVTYE